LSPHEANTLREDIHNSVREHYESVSKEGMFEEIEEYINAQTAKTSDMILIKKLIVCFEILKEYLSIFLCL
jgi:hypothetical protein